MNKKQQILILSWRFSASSIVGAAFFVPYLSWALPPATDTPEEVLRTEIITETTREITFRLERRTAHSFLGETCGECSARLLTLNEAVQVSQIVWNEIIRLVETGKIHSAETANGEVYVCVQSLLDFKP